MFLEAKPDSNSQELKTKREALGISLADIFQRTRISVAYLQAIENNEFHLLPTYAYTKNFIKTYARILNIDSEPILNKYDEFLNSRKGAQKLSPNGGLKKNPFIKRISHPKIYWGITFVLIVISVVVWLISKQYQSSSDVINPTKRIAVAVQENKEQTVNSPVNVTAPVNQPAKVSPNPSLNEVNKQSLVKTQSISTKIEKDAAKPSQEEVPMSSIQSEVNSEETNLLIINAIEETWIRVKADQNPSFQILLKAGEKFERKAVSFNLDIGNAGGIKIQFKDKNMENLGKSGQVIHLRLP